MRIPIWCIAALAATFAAASGSAAAEVAVIPAIALGEEYTDNLFLDQHAKVAEYITHALPSLAGSYAAPFWVWNAAYAYDYRFFANNRSPDEGIHRLAITGTTRLVPDLLFLQIRDDAGRTSLSAVRDYSQDSPVQNQTDFNAFELNPYASLLLTSRTTLTLGYRYRNVTYRDPAAIDQKTSAVYGDFARNLGARTDLTALVSRDRIETSLNARTRTSALAGATYEFQEKSRLWGMAGVSRTAYADGTRETRPIWNAGVIFSTATVSASCETGRTWIDDPSLTEQRVDSYRTELRTGQGRLTAGLSFSHQAYHSVLSGDERKNASAADLTWQLNERLLAGGGLNIERYELHPVAAPGAVTTVHRSEVRIEHHAAETIMVTLSCQNTRSHSADTLSNDYTVNRVYLEAKKIF